MLLLLMPPVDSYGCFRSRPMKFIMTRDTPIVIRSFEHQTGDSTIFLVSNPILRDNTLGSEASYLSPLPPTSREDLCLDGYCVSMGSCPIYVYKHPCLLPNLNTDPMTQQSASLITIPDG
ncbi:uncharacterized protein TNCV_1731191 [Trichonephila clavipes]|nr:uncharacterized protein TNCV_1731191 [Trichonephila clavipes]